MSNSEYLKDALLQQAGSFIDFDEMRAYIRSFAKELLTTSKPDWFYKGHLMIAQEAQQSATSIEQHEFLNRYKQTLYPTDFKMRVFLFARACTYLAHSF